MAWSEFLDNLDARKQFVVQYHQKQIDILRLSLETNLSRPSSPNGYGIPLFGQRILPTKQM